MSFTGDLLAAALQQGSSTSAKEQKLTITKEELTAKLVSNLRQRTGDPKGSIHGIRGSYELFGSVNNWELFKEYYAIPKKSKKSLQTKWLHLSEVLAKVKDSYDPELDMIDCSDWGGIPAAAFTCSSLENTLDLTITNYRVMGVPLTFGIMSAVLFLQGLIFASDTLRKKFTIAHLRAIPFAFLAAELGMYEAGPLGGMKPEILSFISNLYQYEYQGVYEHQDYESIYEEWVAVFGESWEAQCKTKEVFEIIELAFCLVRIAILTERGDLSENKCPMLIGYTFDDLSEEDCLQLAYLLVAHRRAAQGAGVNEEMGDAEEGTNLCTQIDMSWVNTHFDGNTVIEVATRDLMPAMRKLVAIKTNAKMMETFGGM